MVWAQSNIVQMKDFDIYVFVRYLRDVYNIFKPQQHVVTVQTGFRYNKGKARFVVTEFQYVYNPNITGVYIDFSH